MNDKNITLKLKKIPNFSALHNFIKISNGPIQFKSAREIWPLLKLLAKFTRVLACSCSQNFCNCSRAHILVNMCSIA